MIKIGTVHGDVIEAGGVKNVTNNYYGKPEEEVREDLTLESETQVPECLKTEEAEELMEELVGAGLLSEEWQPRVSRSEAALVANMLAEKLVIRNKWKVFEALWHRNNMRGDYNTALEQRKSLEFQEKLKKILR